METKEQIIHEINAVNQLKITTPTILVLDGSQLNFKVVKGAINTLADIELTDGSGASIIISSIGIVKKGREFSILINSDTYKFDRVTEPERGITDVTTPIDELTETEEVVEEEVQQATPVPTINPVSLPVTENKEETKEELSNEEKLKASVTNKSIPEFMNHYVNNVAGYNLEDFLRGRASFFKNFFKVLTLETTSQGDIDYISYRFQFEPCFTELKLLSRITDPKTMNIISYYFGKLDGLTPSVKAPFNENNAKLIRPII